jgi:threonine synthase
MKYVSTRGKAPKLSFKDTFLTGLASDGGLYVPESYPAFSPKEIEGLRNCSYEELAYKILKLFVGSEIAESDLKKIINKTYGLKNFTHKAIAPLKQIDEKIFVLELFHGPTFAFKDFALQLMGNVLEYFLKSDKEKAVILGATSGDTGSAAIYGCKQAGYADIFILHPKGKTSDIQRKQMTTVVDKNVHNVALNGNFDDCQNIVKEIFGDQEFLNGKRLIAVNSINWLRIVGQVIYYFYSYFNVASYPEKISYSVPTGNFGDIFAGYVARKMGLPIEKLVIATNKNDILDRFIQNNSYKKERLKETLSPSMDIQISSNFERMLFEEHGRDAKKIAELMDEFKKTGVLSVSDNIYKNITSLFLSSATNDKETVQVIKDCFAKTKEVLDPHTATAIRASYNHMAEIKTKIVVMATAHPAKFPEALKKAKVDLNYFPENLKQVLKRKERFSVLKNSVDDVKDFIRDTI